MKRHYMIGELTKLYNIGRDSIKYYEELGILKPQRNENGYRVYSIEDVCKLNLIRELRNLNIPMKDIKTYLHKRNIESTKNMLKTEMSVVTKRIEELENQKISIMSRLKAIQKGEEINEFGTIKIKQIKMRKGYIVEGNMINNDNTDFLIQKLRKTNEDNFYILGNNGIGSIFDLESIKNGIYNRYKHVLALLNDNSEEYNFTLSEGEYIVCTYKGDYENNNVYLPKIFEFADKNGYEIISDPIELYDLDIHETSKVNEFITSLQVLVKKRY